MNHDEAFADWAPIGFYVPYVVRLARAAVDLRQVCESPIEVQLGAELTAMAARYFDAAHGLEIVPQFKFSRFRYDFAVMLGQSAVPVVLIECDGEEFHSTPAQRANDRLKDAAATQAGISMLRFTGSEIFRQPRDCVLVILGELLRHARAVAA